MLPDFFSTILPAWLIWAGLAPFIVFYAAHFLIRRRSRHLVEEQIEGKKLLVPVLAFDGSQRWVHWILAGLMVLFLVTGMYVYVSPNAAVDPLTTYAIVSHETITVLASLLLLVHVYHDAIRLRSLHHLSVSLSDLRILIQRAKRLLRLGGEPQLGGKYDIFMRGYHWMLTAAFVVLGIAGIYFWNPFALLPTLPLQTTILLLNVHIAAAVFVVALLLGHVYFALIPENRAILSAMLNGHLDPDFYSRNYDQEAWPPNVLIVKSSILTNLTKSLSKSEFQRVTGFEDRSFLKSKTVRVPFETIQTTCGRYKLKEGEAWCSQKRRACSPDSCPALGTYIPVKGVTIQEQVARVQRRRFLTRTVPAIAVVGLFAVLMGWEVSQSLPPSSIITGPPPGPQQAIANLNTMPKNSSIDFTALNGNPSTLIRLADGTLVAYSRICTHAGCLVDYNTPSSYLYCPCHGAVFDPASGSVLRGPAIYPLSTVSVRVDPATGNIYAA